MVAPHEQAPAARGEAIYPRNGVLPFRLGGVRQAKKFAQFCEGDGLGIDPGANHMAHRNFYFRDDSGQPQATYGGGEPVRILGGCAANELPVGTQQCERQNMIAEGSHDVMILAMDIICHRATHGDPLCSRGYWQGPSARYQQTLNIVE